MNVYIRIAGAMVLVEGRSQVFPGVGRIRAVALEKTSKNRYKAFLIADFGAWFNSFDGLGKAVDEIQRWYNDYGTFLPNVGESKGAVGAV